MPYGMFRILTGVPLDRKYQNQLYFPSEAAQNAYFLSKQLSGSSPTSTTFLRIDEVNAKVKIEANYLDLKNANYLILNDTYAGKSETFYCFINNIIYLNDRTTEITFEIDVIQSYMFKWQLNECLVERCTVANDQIGLHTLPEPVQVNDPIVRTFYKSGYFSAWSVVMFFKGKEFIYSQGQARPVNFRVFNGYIGDCGMYINNLITNVDSSGITVDANAELELFTFMRDKFQDLSSDFLTAILFPTAFILDQTDAMNNKNVEIKTESISTMPTDFNYNGVSYTPKNNKVLCYPYNYLEADSPTGHIQFKYENTGLGAPLSFKLYGTLSPNASIACRLEDTSNYKEDEILTLGNFPTVAMTKDAYLAYLREGGQVEAYNNSASATLGIAGAIAAGVAGIATGGVAPAVTSLALSGASIASGVYGFNLKQEAMERKGDIQLGTYNNTVLTDIGLFNFLYKKMQIKPEEARVVDDYFTKYGYCVNKLMTPPMHNRSRYTYVKCKDFTCQLSAPLSIIEKISNIFNSGVTFWVYSDAHIGDYSQDNNTL